MLEDFEEDLHCGKDYLSRGGILFLVKSILLRLTTYFISLFVIPIKVSLLFEKIHTTSC